jgi:hypothetical protein
LCVLEVQTKIVLTMGSGFTGANVFVFSQNNSMVYCFPKNVLESLFSTWDVIDCIS